MIKSPHNDGSGLIQQAQSTHTLPHQHQKPHHHQHSTLPRASVIQDINLQAQVTYYSWFGRIIQRLILLHLKGLKQSWQISCINFLYVWFAKVKIWATCMHVCLLIHRKWYIPIISWYWIGWINQTLCIEKILHIIEVLGFSCAKFVSCREQIWIICKSSW